VKPTERRKGEGEGTKEKRRGARAEKAMMKIGSFRIVTPTSEGEKDGEEKKKRERTLPRGVDREVSGPMRARAITKIGKGGKKGGGERVIMYTSSSLHPPNHPWGP